MPDNVEDEDDEVKLTRIVNQAVTKALEDRDAKRASAKAEEQAKKKRKKLWEL